MSKIRRGSYKTGRGHAGQLDRVHPWGMLGINSGLLTPSAIAFPVPQHSGKNKSCLKQEAIE
jgi:hypothetical protein